MTDFFGGFVIGCIFCVLLNLIPWSYTQQAKVAMRECERNLPRTEHCVITAVAASRREG